jgi:predicted DCC family thiol-disulfide oxidoreductase YuxK
MTEHRDRHFVLFDGDCGICTWSADWVKRRDRRGRFAVEPYQAVGEDELRRFGLSYEDCAKKAWVVTRKGRVFGGAFAVNYVLLSLPPWMILAIAFYLIPPLLLIEVTAYYLVARNRHRLSRMFGMKACSWAAQEKGATDEHR